MFLKERVKHAVRFRHKRGFGVHSPFVFNLITTVIKDKRKDYVYPEKAEKIEGVGRKNRKFCRLVFRVANFLKADCIYCDTDQSEVLLAYFSGFPGKVSIERGEMSEADVICIGRWAEYRLGVSELENFLQQNEKKRCIFISDIHRKGENKYLWLLGKEKAQVSIDMMWYGILFFDRKLQKGNYHLMIR